MPERPAGDGELSEFLAETDFSAHPLTARARHEADTSPVLALPLPDLLPALEFELSAEDAAHLMRSSVLARIRAGRVRRAAPADRVWHDTADGALNARALALSESGGRWRLEALRPEAASDWLPATPAPILAEAATLDAVAAAFPGGVLPAPLVPLAAFKGSWRELSLCVDDAPARLGILQGTLQGVVRQEPCCRLILFGQALALAPLAEELAAHFYLRVPPAGLAASARAVANGQPPAPRRLGAPEIQPGSTVSEAFGCIVAHLADVVLYWGSRIGQVDDPEPVHQMRVAVRRWRSALSVFRRALPNDGGWLTHLESELKALAATLGAARDWDVFIAETGARVALAFPEDRRVAGMLAAAGRKRDAAYAGLNAFLAPGPDRHWHRLGLTLALLATRRPWDNAASEPQAECLAAPVMAFAAGALDRRLKHLLAPGGTLAGTPTEKLHEIRKQAKRLRYAIEFFAPLFPAKPVRKYLARLTKVQKDFGEVNDSAVAAQLVAGLGGGADRAFAAGAVQGFGAAGQARALRRIQKGWAVLYRAAPFWD